MAITLEAVNSVLDGRDMDTVEQPILNQAIDFAMAIYGVPYATLNATGESPAQLVLGVAYLASILDSQAEVQLTATAAVKSVEEELEGVGSIKETYADAPTDPYPVVGGLLGPFSSRSASSGVSFGRSTR